MGADRCAIMEVHQMAGDWSEEITHVAGTDLAIIKGGQGKPLFVLHEEMGHPGWLNWHAALAKERTILIPIQPGFGKSPRIEAIRNVHELGLFYSWVLRDMNLAPVDVIGFSLGGWVAAEMAVANPRQFRKMVLVAPLGIKPPEGEIFDIFVVTQRTPLNLSIHDPDSTPEFNQLYGGERTPEQFEAFEDARSEIARLAWEPYFFSHSLPKLLEGVAGLPTLIIWGRQDAVVPLSAGEAYHKAIAGSKLAVLDQCGHRPEIEKTT